MWTPDQGDVGPQIASPLVTPEIDSPLAQSRRDGLRATVQCSVLAGTAPAHTVSTSDGRGPIVRCRHWPFLFLLYAHETEPGGVEASEPRAPGESLAFMREITQGTGELPRALCPDNPVQGKWVCELLGKSICMSYYGEMCLAKEICENMRKIRAGQ